MSFNTTEKIGFELGEPYENASGKSAPNSRLVIVNGEDGKPCIFNVQDQEAFVVGPETEVYQGPAERDRLHVSPEVRKYLNQIPFITTA